MSQPMLCIIISERAQLPLREAHDDLGEAFRILDFKAAAKLQARRFGATDSCHRSK